MADTSHSTAQHSGPPRTRPCRLEARAFVDDQLVASSSAALEVERDGAVPMLCFPTADVRGELGAHQGLLLTAAPPGYVAFDQSQARVRLLLVDDMLSGGGEGQRDRTFKRFPPWGDVTDLIDILDVRPAGPGQYVSVTRAHAQRGVVEGSQMLGQSIVAAGRHAPGRRAVFASMVFMRAASVSEPLHFALEEQSGGRNFTTLGVRVTQAGKLCASGLMLLDVKAPDIMRHAVAAPDTPGPYDSVPYDMSVTGRDLRFVDGAYTGDPNAPLGPPVLDAWLRYRALPDDPYLHAGLLAQFTGHASIATAMRPHAGIGQSQAHRTLSTAINAIQLSLHAEIRADDWLLYRHHSTFAGDGMTHSECRVHAVKGQLLASFSVDAMVRGFATERPVNDRTSL